MRRRLTLWMALLALPTLLLVGYTCGAGSVELPEASVDETAVFVGQQVIDALESDGEVHVLIGLRPPEGPLSEATTERMRQNTEERAARVLSVLTSSDFTLTRQFDIAPALSGLLTESGLTKLTIHPDVMSIGVTGGATIH